MKQFATPIDSKLPNVKTTIFTTIGNLARTHHTIDLSQGFPNFPTDSQLIDLVTKAMQEGHNQYAAMQGYYGLREVISEKIEKLYGRNYHPETEITITVGATQAIYTAITAFVHPGDEVIVLKPAYDCYEPAIELNGGIPICVQLNAPDYAVDWEAFKAKISTKTKMVIINTPHNPSGRIFAANDMLQLQEILCGTNIILISDEVYEHIVFDGEAHESAARFDDLASRSFICASFGKTFHVTGWKMGYCVAPKELMQEFQKTHQFAVFSVDHPTQRAMAAYLEEEQHYLALSAFYQQKRDFFLEAIKSSRFEFTPSQGTYFQLLNYEAITDENDEDFAKRLITDHQLASIPISSFNVDNRNDNVLRFCFAKKQETLEKAAAILNSL
ncbi:aminotransferase class I/II-fold pyridoxal phosphate-dependent enzyme [Aggregatimonas sangjinii]|uniref:Aminotransferase class I/II-fold pyridoxal phosphate-dependent enzyme n=1 Tax=Aggregatimonas sangjinii TaxID=2583587 RepID=A0A5B7SSZ3_9FLAO|nr:methionine aminotransferase [Aggregatimonas sangjinii]QCX01796.1 aminotransferase class I/II-fold pyridoxal phosphate-dependent enzyme [Aggregatimonas sangjinii]